jgi:hypothetical protein
VILVGVGLAVIVGLLRGGRLDRLEHLGIKGLAFVWLALGMRVAAGVLAVRGFSFGPWFQIGAYLMFLYIVGLNLSLPGMKTFGLGSLLNFAAIVLNGGTMPVSADAIAAAGILREPVGTHSLLSTETKLWFLADVIPVRWPPQVLSVGDLLIVVGIFMFIQYRMLVNADTSRLVLGEE